MYLTNKKLPRGQPRIIPSSHMPRAAQSTASSVLKLFRSKMQSAPAFDINDLLREAQVRWLKPAEVYFILENCEDHHLLPQSAEKPPSGSLCLYNKRVLRNFRRDGHNWRKKKDGRTVGEAHERLKRVMGFENSFLYNEGCIERQFYRRVGNVEALNCYYAHGEDNPSFQRRSFWMLSGERDHIVLVQYLNVANQSPGSVSQPSVLISPASTFSLSPSTATNQESVFIDGQYGSRINLKSPVSSEISSDIGISKNVVESYNSLGKTSEAIPSDTEVNQALRMLEEQLSLDDDNLNEINSFRSQCGTLNSPKFEDYGVHFANNGPLDSIFDGSDYTALDSSYGGIQDGLSSFVHEAGDPGMGHQQISGYMKPGLDKDSLSWTEMMDFGECISPSLGGAFPQNNGNLQDLSFSSFTSSRLCSQDRSMSFDTEKTFIQSQSCSNLNVGQKQKFSIRDVSPEWGYSFETTKVILVGSFLCHPSEHAWTCMFGDTEVPIQIIQEGVILCEAPPKPSGKVTLCITSANRESCSEVREFEYRSKTSNCTQCATNDTETTLSSEELLLLARLSQMLLCGAFEETDDKKGLGNAIPKKDNVSFNEYSWSLILQSLLDGSGTFAGTMTWLLQKFIKDKLLAWLSSKTREGSGESYCLLSRNEQEIIHMIAGLGYEWALTPILNSGININFRDINGWTALHWAARFGREKMVACLIASGAFAGAVTDPNGQDPTGKTPASIAAINGHKGLAGYLSEAALTSHLSSLALQESELSKGLAVLEAEHTVSRVSEENILTCEDQLSLQDTLAAVRNAASAAARIQAAYRAHSFRKRQQRKSSNADSIRDYGFSSDNIPGLSAVSKYAFRDMRVHNSAALSIQKNFRGYKGRKAFMDFRKKVVKIQAHVRGHRTRKSYVVCWATGILEKVILRWRRKGVGLRGFKPEVEAIDESDEEDIARVFQKKNVEGAIEEAVSRVLSMVESVEARKQYRRILERYRQAKAQLGNTANEEALGSGPGSMDNDQTLQDSFSLYY